MQKRKTKIICSIGPSTSEDNVVSEIILAGMNVARLNFSHGSHDTHRDSIERVRRVAGKLGFSTAILLDTKGPEIRTGMVENDGKIGISKGESVIVTAGNSQSTAVQGQSPAHIAISWKDAASKLQAGHHILVADGLLDLEVIDVKGGQIMCRANNTAMIGSKKNVNLIGVHAHLPIMSEQDKKDIAFGVEMGVDFIAASFVSFPHEITEIRKYLESFNSSIKIIAKIENAEGVDNIQEIANLADGIMVARGDLGVQLPTEQIPLVQKHIICVCRRVGKPVITATQMLESMIVNPRPTRAELTDVANAIFDGTDAVMLSGETTVGAYPVEAVKTIDKIARTIEESNEFRKRMKNTHVECLCMTHNPGENMGIIMSRYGVEAASELGAKAIVTPTLSGNTARILSVYRPDEPVIALTPDEKAVRVMQLFWGVNAYHTPYAVGTDSMIQNAMKMVSDKGIAEISDKIILIAGLPIKSPHMVNTVRVLVIGTVLARSESGGFANPDMSRIQGRLIFASNPHEAHDQIETFGGEILVCKAITKDYSPFLRIVRGVICEGHCEISEDDLRSLNPDLVWLTQLKQAREKFEQGQTVTIDAKQLLVYEGSV